MKRMGRPGERSGQPPFSPPPRGCRRSFGSPPTDPYRIGRRLPDTRPPPLAMASAWWVLSWANEPWRPKLTSSGQPLRPPIHPVEVPLLPHAVQRIGRGPVARPLRTRCVGGSPASHAVADHLPRNSSSASHTRSSAERGSRHSTPCVPGARPCRPSSWVRRAG